MIHPPRRIFAVLFCWCSATTTTLFPDDLKTAGQLRDEAKSADAQSGTDNRSKLGLIRPDSSRRASCPDPVAIELFKHQIAYERTEERYPLKGLQEIHADVWERGHVTAFYVREQLKDAVPTVRMVYTIANKEVRGDYTCPAERNWKECIERSEGVEAANNIPRTCMATIDVRAIPAWKPSPNDATKRLVAETLRREIEARWPGAQEIVIRDFNLRDNQITMYLKMPDGDYFQGCGFHASGEPHCEGWHLFGQAPLPSVRRWIFEEPYRLK
jgi:hypothetical protein